VIAVLIIKCIKDVILHYLGKINTSKAWIAGSSYSHFKNHHAVRNNFSQQRWSAFSSFGIMPH